MIILRENETIASKPFEVADIFDKYYKSLSDYDGKSDTSQNLSQEEVILKHSSHQSVALIKSIHAPLTYLSNLS